MTGVQTCALPIYFVNAVRAKAVGQDVLRSVSPGQMVVKIVHDHLVETLGAEGTGALNLNAVPPVEMAMVIGERSTIDGMMKLDSAGWSTTLTGTERACAAADTLARNRSSSSRIDSRPAIARASSQQRAVHTWTSPTDKPKR